MLFVTIFKNTRTQKKLKPENGGSTEKLSDEQSKSLEKHLETYTYMYVKDIVAYVKKMLIVDGVIY